MIPPLIQIVQAILPPIASILTSILPLVVEIANIVLPVLVNVISSLLPVITPLLDLLLSILQNVVMPLLPPIMSLVEALLPGIVSLLDMITPILTPILSILGPIADVIGVIVGAISKVVGWISSGLGWLVKLFFGDSADTGKAQEIAGYATGGFTNGLSFAGEDPRYPTEAVISFNPAYRAQNIQYWTRAGEMLGVSTESSDNEILLGGSNTSVVYDLSGLSFSPQIKVEGNADTDTLMKKLKELEPEFVDFVLEALARREAGSYVTADSGLY